MRILITLFLYVVFPVLVVLVCFSSGNWYGLFYIVAYYLGLLMAALRQWIFFPIPLVFCIWFWYTYGISPTHFVSLSFVSLTTGACLYEGYRYINRLLYKVLPEQFSNLDYNEKVAEMNRRIEQFKKDNPGKQLTSEIMEKIRTDVFFQ